jgi:hypothetical protein
MAEWTKLGFVLAPMGTAKSRTHAMLPTPLVSNGAVRVYFASCDADMRGRIFSADLDAADPTKILDLNPEPVFDLGEPGSFDADGVNPSQLIDRDGVLFLYYIGWRRHSESVPYTLLSGLAVSEDGGKKFTRLSSAPILPPVEGECYFRTAPHVYRAAGGWNMLYIGGDTFFTAKSGKRLPTYSLYRLHSKDGVAWQGAGEKLAEPDALHGEIGFGRPWLWTDMTGDTSLLISVRSEAGYRLCKIPTAGISLANREFKELLPRSELGWDSEMVCFGAPYAVAGCEYLLYNGNGFGRTGFGAARRVSTAETAIVDSAKG